MVRQTMSGRFEYEVEQMVKVLTSLAHRNPPRIDIVVGTLRRMIHDKRFYERRLAVAVRQKLVDNGIIME